MTVDQLWNADLHTPAVDAVLASAREAANTETVFLGGFAPADYRFLRVVGDFPGFAEGSSRTREGWLCDAMLAGAPKSTSDTSTVTGYASLKPVTELGVRSYVGVPLTLDGDVVGTLCGIDHRSVQLLAPVVELMVAAARIIETLIVVDQSPVIRRAGSGWRVGASDGLDLTAAMSLADLLADDVTTPPRPPRVDTDTLSETEQLRTAVGQLEHALGARVLVEQAIGVLCERQQLGARGAFDRMRKAARTRGRKVHDLAREVVASATDPTVPLPPELTRRVSPAPVRPHPPQPTSGSASPECSSQPDSLPLR